MSTLLKQPLIHFLLVGFGFFLIFQMVNREDAIDERTVIVDKEALMNYFQFQSKAFDQEVFEKKLAEMPPEELQQLIDEFVRDEVLYREAKAMGMDQEDFIIKRRMIQKVEFISEGIAEAASNVSEEDLKNYYEDNKEDYFLPPFATFTHVYFSNDRGKDQALKQAEKELAYLNQNSVSFSEARSRGDFFLFNANYVERTPDYVASHFGKSMTQSVFELEPSEEQWYGPFESPYGFHLVMLTKREEGRYPAFDEVRQRVMGDAELEAKRAKQEETIQSIIDAYDVRITFQQNG